MKLIFIFILFCLGLSWNGGEARHIAELELRELVRWNEWDWQALTKHIRQKRQAEIPQDTPSVSADDADNSNPTESQVDVTTIKITPTTSQNFDNTVSSATTPKSNTSFLSSFTAGTESLRQTMQSLSNTIQGITTNVSNIVNDVIKAVNKMADGLLNKQPQQ